MTKELTTEEIDDMIQAKADEIIAKVYGDEPVSEDQRNALVGNLTNAYLQYGVLPEVLVLEQEPIPNYEVLDKPLPMPEWTPGPWTRETHKIKRDGSESLLYTFIEANKGWANSGMVNKRTVAEIGHWKDRPNPEADARLIMYAPETAIKLHYVPEAMITTYEYAMSQGFDSETAFILTVETIQDYVRLHLAKVLGIEEEPNTCS